MNKIYTREGNPISIIGDDHIKYNYGNDQCIYELTTIEKIIDDLKSYNKKIKISLKEVLFDDGVEDQVMTIKKVIDHIKRLDKNTLIMASKSFWEDPNSNLSPYSYLKRDKKWPISLEIIKVIENSNKILGYPNREYNIIDPENNIEDVPNVQIYVQKEICISEEIERYAFGCSNWRAVFGSDDEINKS